MEKKKSAAKRVGAIVGIILAVVLGAVIGYFAIKPTSAGSGGSDNMLLLEVALLLVSLYFSFALHMILHEGGHLLGGLLSGYQFTSFRVSKIIFIKENDRLATKKHNIAGTMGQCLMTPPEQSDSDFPFLLYNLSGGLANLLWSGVFLLIYVLLRDAFNYSGVVFIPLIGVGALLGASNLIPLRLSGVANDGHNILTLKKSESARRAFHIVLHMNAKSLKGVRHKDMPAEWFKLPDDYNDPVSLSIAISYFNLLMDNHDFGAAREFGVKILAEADKMLEIHKNELRCELLFIEMIGEQRQDEVERLYTNDLKKYMKASGSHLSKRRIMYAYSKLIALDEAEAEKALDRLNKTFLVYPYKGELELERELVDIIDSLGA